MHRRDILKSIGGALTAGVSSSQVRASTQDATGTLTAGGEIAAHGHAESLFFDDALPAWAYPGKIRFALWDGGPIEAAKAILSGWPLFVPVDPNVLYATVNWYDPRTIRFIKDGGFNAIWVEWSVGFSQQTERHQQEIVTSFIKACHNQGINVIAYMAMSNMFWEDMFEKVPDSRNWVWFDKTGKPRTYGGGADYKEVGRATRYLADPSNPHWIEYLKQRVALAIDAGADGLFYDNVPYGHKDSQAISKEIYAYARKKKPDFLMCVNFHRHLDILARDLNAIYTEDAFTPGYFRDHPDEPEKLISNIGYLRYLHAISQGWRPILVQGASLPVGSPQLAGAKGAGWGDRPLNSISPRHHQLSQAECAAFGAIYTLYLEGGFLKGVYWEEPWAVATLKAVGDYNLFFKQNEQHYGDLKSLAKVGILVDESPRIHKMLPPARIDFSDQKSYSGGGILDALANKSVIYDILFEQDVDLRALSAYEVVIAPDTQNMRDSAADAVLQYVKTGGIFIASQQTSFCDADGEKRPEPALSGLFALKSPAGTTQKVVSQFGRGESIYYPGVPDIDDVVQEIKRRAGEPLVQVSAPESVRYNAVGYQSRHEIAVHLLNYSQSAVEDINIRIKGNIKAVEILSPDDLQRGSASLTVNAGYTEFVVPNLLVYDLIVAHLPA
jgi:hypothetical protein